MFKLTKNFRFFLLVLLLFFIAFSSSGCITDSEWFTELYGKVRKVLNLEGGTESNGDSPTPVSVTDNGDKGGGYEKKAPGVIPSLTIGTEGVKPGCFHSPLGVAVDYEGNVYVSDTGNSRVQKFTYDSKEKKYVYVNAYGKRGSDIGELDKPYGIAVWDGFLYVADNQNSRITKIDSSGQFLSAKGNDGDELGEFHHPVGLSFDLEGNLFVADSGNDRVQKVGYEGLENNNAYSKSGAIDRYTGTMPINNPWNTHFPKYNEGPNTGQFKNPWDVLPLPSGDVLVLDTKNHRVQRFGPHGDFIDQWGQVGREEGQFQYPTFAAIDQFGSVIISDTGNHRMEKFSQDGEFQVSWGEGGYLDGQFNQPHGIAVCPRTGYIFIADTENHRVQVFAYKTFWGQPLSTPEGETQTEPETSDPEYIPSDTGEISI